MRKLNKKRKFLDVRTNGKEKRNSKMKENNNFKRKYIKIMIIKGKIAINRQK